MSLIADEGLDQIATAAIERLRELCAISSESGNTQGLRSVAARLQAELERHGLRVEVKDEDDANGVPQPVLLARGPASGGAHLLLLGHMDTVLSAVPPRIEEGKLFATGSYDMKGGLSVFIGALELLGARGRHLPQDVLLVLVPDEESESLISGNSARRWSENARAVLVLEPGQTSPSGETLVAGRRGMVEWKLKVTGRASHSGLAYWTGRSALAAAAEWCARAQDLSRRGPGPTVNVGRLVGGGADFVDGLAQHHDMLGSARQLNVVSDKAVAEGETRFLTEGDRDAILAALRELTDSLAASYEVTMAFTTGMQVPPVDPHGPGRPYIERTVKLAEARGFHLDVEDDRGGISFPNFIADPARTPVIDGLGPTGDGMHVRGEYVNIDSLARRIALLADLLPTL